MVLWPRDLIVILGYFAGFQRPFYDARLLNSKAVQHHEQRAKQGPGNGCLDVSCRPNADLTIPAM